MNDSLVHHGAFSTFYGKKRTFYVFWFHFLKSLDADEDEDQDAGRRLAEEACGGRLLPPTS